MPEILNLSISSKTADSVTVDYQVNVASGAIWVVAVPTGQTAPTALQIRSGTDYLDQAAPSSSESISALTGTLPAIEGLTLQDYDFHAVMDHSGDATRVLTGGFGSGMPNPSFAGALSLPASNAVLSLLWRIPTTNSDASALRDLKTHKVYWGTASGVYSDSVDLSTTAYPGVTEYDIPGLADGQTYYVAVAAIDSEGNESALSSEVSGQAAIPTTAAEPTWTDITTLPYTINTSGNYRLVGNLTVNSGAGITVSAADVTLYGGNRSYSDGEGNASLTFCETGAGQAISLGSGLNNIDIYGFDFVRGNGVTSSRANGAFAVYGTSFGTGVKVHDCDFVLDLSYTIGVFATTNMNDIRVYNNTAAINNGTTTLSFVTGNSSSWYRVYSNTITQDSTVGYVGAFHLTDGGSVNGEFYKNTVTLNSTLTNGGFVFQSWAADDVYIHDNTLISYGNQCRMINPDGGSTRWTMLHNTISMLNVGGTGTSRTLRCRYGSNGHNFGYNTVTATGDDNARGLSIGGNDASWNGTPQAAGDVTVYHNSITSESQAFELYVDEAGQTVASGVYSWNNTYTGQAGGSAIVQNAGGAGPMTDVHFNSDTVTGTISNNQTGTTWRVDSSFVSGDVTGETASMTFDAGAQYPVNNTPSAPSGLTLV